MVMLTVLEMIMSYYATRFAFLTTVAFTVICGASVLMHMLEGNISGAINSLWLTLANVGIASYLRMEASHAYFQIKHRSALRTVDSLKLFSYR